jgi:tRNA-dihydrouridine synthase
MMTRADFLDLIEAFIERYEVRATVLGRDSIGDPNLVFDLRNGRELREATRNRVLSYMQDMERRFVERASKPITLSEGEAA